MRKTLSVAALVLAFSCPAAAGIMHNPEPDQEPKAVVQEPTTTTEENTTEATESLTLTALDVASSILFLL